MLDNQNITQHIQHQGLTAPLTVTWEITNRCNLQCAHCLSDSGPQASTSLDLSLVEAKQVVDQLAENKVFQIHFGGGEPFVYPAFMELLEHAQQRGFCCLCISTNGALLTTSRITALERMGGIYLQLSLDGAKQETCDALRGQGAFQRAVEALERLRNTKIVRTVNFVYSRQNSHELDEMLVLARRYDATLRVTRLKPSGRGRDVFSNMQPTPEQQTHLHGWLVAHPEVLTGDTFFHLNPLGGKGLGGFQFCGAGRMTCLITPNGDVYPCAFTQTENFLAGSLRRATFGEIWRGSAVFDDMFRGKPEGACGDCAALDACGGGCPAVKHAVTGRLDVPDPECVLGLVQPRETRPLCDVD